MFGGELEVTDFVQNMVEQAIGVYEHQAAGGEIIRPISKGTIEIVDAIQRALRPYFRLGPPDNERMVQDAIENILNAVGVEFTREMETAPGGAKSFRPDFVVQGEDLAIEVKLSKQGHGAKEIEEELAADITGYRTRWKLLLAVIYDLSEIADPHQFRQAHMKHYGVTVEIIKH